MAAQNDEEQNTPDWCKCDNCVIMPKEEENVCCFSKEGNVPHDECITRHIDFIPMALNKQKILEELKKKGSGKEEKEKQSSCRDKAYKRFHNWFFGPQGKGNRNPNPSCVVTHIRKEFPDPDNSYMGYKSSNK